MLLYFLFHKIGIFIFKKNERIDQNQIFFLKDHFIGSCVLCLEAHNVQFFSLFVILAAFDGQFLNPLTH